MKIIDFLKHCLNPKVILSVVAVIIGLFIFLPSKSHAAAYAPLLLALICPLSMVFMMKKIHSSNKLPRGKPARYFVPLCENAYIASSSMYASRYSLSWNKIYDETVAKVLPEKGFQSKISLKDSIVKLVKNGVIDKKKFKDIYKERDGLSQALRNILDKSSNKQVHLTRENTNIYVNLLWLLELSNYISTNINSPINADNGKDLYNYASTGEWNIGKEEMGQDESKTGTRIQLFCNFPVG